MVSLCNVRSLRPSLLLQLITAVVFIACSATAKRGKYRPTWSQYTDAMYALCISGEDVTVSSKLTTLWKCFNVQRDYIQCIPSNRPEDSLLVVPSSPPSVLQTPCGSIHLLNATAIPFARSQWTITVHNQFYLNLTFLKLILPMPYSRCDREHAFEHLQIHHQKDVAFKGAVFLCGEHSSFSMIWRDSRAWVVYRRVPSITQMGHFRIQYQVCNQNVRTLKVATMQHSSLLQPARSFAFQLSYLRSFGSAPRHVMYSVHLLGNRLRLLDVILVLHGTTKEHFSIDAFDGPGPAELHRHRTDQQAVNAKWINFLTFQAYLQITCEKYHCSRIFVKYRWPSGLRYIHTLMVPREMNKNDFSRLCSKGSYWYCLFQVRAPIRENVEISLQELNFHGPDYLRGLNKSHNCLLAGVTIADGYRGTIMSNEHDESYFKGLGDIPRGLAVDSIFPEITTCYDVPLAHGDKVVMGFPTDTFVSFSQTLLLVIYAYGAYVDLSRSDIKMVIRPSHSAGLIVGCPTIPADGYLTVGSRDYSWNATISMTKQSICPLGNVLLIKVLPWSTDRPDALASDVIFCTTEQRMMAYTMVIIAPHFSDQIGPGAVRSLLVQMNLYAAEMKMYCHIDVNDVGMSNAKLDYDLSIEDPVILGGAEYNIAVTNLTSFTHNFGKRKLFTGRYPKLLFFTSPTYPKVKLNVSLPCSDPSPLDLSGGRENRFENHLKQAADTAYCLHYLIPLSYVTKDNNTHFIHIPKPYYQTIFDNFTHKKAKAGKLTAFLFNFQVSKFLFVVKISLHGTCAVYCKHVKVQIVYKTLVSLSVVSLEWTLVLKFSGIQVTLSDMPHSGFLLYIMPLNDKCMEKVCSANIDIQYDTKQDHVLPIWNSAASNQTPFAANHLLWTHRQYTWNAAEEICQELDGMHLASISTEKEYLLVSRMLLGSGYYDMDIGVSRLPILTPCLLGSPLCVIHVGLKIKVR